MRLILRLLRRLKSFLSHQPDNHFFTKDHFQEQILNYGWQIGEFSYGKPVVIGGLVAKLHIGKYCSISENCSVILADHNLNHTSTYPFRNIGLSGIISPQPIPDLHAVSKGDISIGNDVWIGRNTTICKECRPWPGRQSHSARQFLRTRSSGPTCECYRVAHRRSAGGSQLVSFTLRTSRS